MQLHFLGMGANEKQKSLGHAWEKLCLLRWLKPTSFELQIINTASGNTPKISHPFVSCTRLPKNSLLSHQVTKSGSENHHRQPKPWFKPENGFIPLGFCGRTTAPAGQASIFCWPFRAPLTVTEMSGRGFYTSWRLYILLQKPSAKAE